MKKWKILIFVGVVILIAFVFLVKSDKKIENKISNTITIAGETILNIEIADTQEERVRGLSGRKSLAEDTGLLFVFDTEGYYGIWMKNMNFPIDIAWLDKNKKIINIESNVYPDTYPNVFYSFEKSHPILNLYVLETNANFFNTNKVKIGDTLDF